MQRETNEDYFVCKKTVFHVSIVCVCVFVCMYVSVCLVLFWRKEDEVTARNHPFNHTCAQKASRLVYVRSACMCHRAVEQ